eukprot:3643020-Rhodomonas_salina.1
MCLGFDFAAVRPARRGQTWTVSESQKEKRGTDGCGALVPGGRAWVARHDAFWRRREPAVQGRNQEGGERTVPGPLSTGVPGRCTRAE